MRGYWRRRSKISTAIRSNLSEGSWWKWKKRRRVGAEPLLMRLKQWKWSQQYSFPASLTYMETKAAWKKEEENHLDLPNVKKEITSLQAWRKTGRDNWPEAQTPGRSSPFLWFGGIQHVFVTCFGPCAVPRTGVTAVNKSDKNPCFCGIDVLVLDSEMITEWRSVEMIPVTIQWCDGGQVMLFWRGGDMWCELRWLLSWELLFLACGILVP